MIARKLSFLIILWALCVINSLGNSSCLVAKEPVFSLKSFVTQERLQELQMKTFGGRHYWGDMAFFRGWRIQHNVVFGQHRLLDPKDNRHHSGTLEECQAKLEEIKTEQQIPPMKGKAVVIIHGIIRSSKSFSPLIPKLKAAGYTVVNFDYPSTQISIPESANYLHHVLDSLEGIEEVNFVVHSMGGLIVRSYLNEHRDRRIKRLVMLGVPNFGAEIADFFKEVRLFKFIYGPAGQQLITDQKALIAELPTPDFEFAIIAGGRKNETGFNPILPGDNDGTVTVASARLPGATDFTIVNCMHSFLPNHSESGDRALRYIQTGSLHEDGKKYPVPFPEEEKTGSIEENSEIVKMKEEPEED